MFFTYRNVVRAKLKGANPFLWGFLTILLFSAGAFLGTLVSFIAVFKNNLDWVRLEKDQVKYSQELAVDFNQAMIGNPIHSITIMLFALGGYLLVRYILSNMKDIELPNNEM